MSLDPREGLRAALGRWVAAPCVELAELCVMLDGIDAWGRREREPRGVFAAAYAVVTKAILADHERGVFNDPAWVRELVLDFGERYRVALLAMLHGGAAHACWAEALAPAPLDGQQALRSLVVGMVAHIHYDLVLALYQAAPLGPAQRADYEQIGRSLAHVTPAIQREVICGYAPELATLHAALGGLDTKLTDAVVQIWRWRATGIADRMRDSPLHADLWTLRLQAESAALARVAGPTTVAGAALLSAVTRSSPFTSAVRRGSRAARTPGLS